MPDREAILRFLKEHRLHFIIAAGAIALFLSVMLLLSAIGGREGEASEPVTSAPPATLIPPEEAFLPNERAELLELEEFRYREPRTPWEEALVEEFWNPARETAIEALTDQAGRQIDELFERVE